jgi:ribosomal-protein-alanine N-acetyltransferase
MKLTLRPATSDELDLVAEIESLSMGSGWTREAFVQDFALSWSRLYVACIDDEVVAFCNYWIVVDEVQILNVATHPAHRRRGLAERLLQQIIADALSQRLASLTLEVRKSNLSAQSLYQKLGFQKVGERPRYYIDNQEAAILMTLLLYDGSVPG